MKSWTAVGRVLNVSGNGEFVEMRARRVVVDVI